MAVRLLNWFPDDQSVYTVRLDGLSWRLTFRFQARLGYYTMDVDLPDGRRLVSGRALTPSSYHALGPVGGPPGVFFVASELDLDREFYTQGDVSDRRVRLFYNEALPELG